MLFHNYYWYFKEVIPKRICNDLINYALSKQTNIATIASVSEDEIKKDKNKLLNLQKTRNSNIVWLRDQWIYNEILPFVRSANVSANWNFDWDYSEDCQFTIYKENQFYDWHPDASPTPYNNNKIPQLNNKIRKLSVTVSLSPAEEYEGGELEFYYPTDNPELKPFTKKCEEIKEQGSVVVFPSYIVHRVKPVTKGTRYSLVVWNVGNPYR